MFSRVGIRGYAEVCRLGVRATKVLEVGLAVDTARLTVVGKGFGKGAECTIHDTCSFLAGKSFRFLDNEDGPLSDERRP